MNRELIKKIFSKEYSVGLLGKISAIVDTFSVTEKIVFTALSGTFIISALFILGELNNALTVEIPAKGGEITEGVIGIPRFINPLIAFSDADRDLTTLLYSGLMRASGGGTLTPDLAESYEVLNEGLTYEFHLRENATFHDGVRVTADDVVFTIQKAQDPSVKSTKRASWEGVTIEKIDERTVRIHLKQAYAPFLENATLGILPSHIWHDVDGEQFTFSQYNIDPIGSGPYQIDSIKRSSGGVPSAYTLKPFRNYTLGEPYISKLNIRFYNNEDALIDALESKEIDSINTITPQRALALKALGHRIESVPLPRVFAIFFNQNEAPLFTQREVRVALNNTLDRSRIVDEVLSGYGVEIKGPLPVTLESSLTDASTSTPDELLADAAALLAKNGWKANPNDGVLEKTVKKEKFRLEFSIATANSPELKAAAEIAKESWERLGAKVTLSFFDTGYLNQSVIRPRKYDALLFGEVVGRDLDLFAFWHSSQRNDPGLNVSLYTSITADKLLESGRKTTDFSERLAAYHLFEAEIAKDIPAIFMYSPHFIYILPKFLQGVQLNSLAIPSERFLNAHVWYIETDHVWKIFAKNL